jgi:hypothetical protein
LVVRIAAAFRQKKGIAAAVLPFKLNLIGRSDIRSDTPK